MNAIWAKASRIKRWIESLDKTGFYIPVGLMVFGWVQMLSVSGAIGRRTSINPMMFGGKQTIFILVGFVVMLTFALLSMKQIGAVSIPALLCFTMLLVLALFAGESIKGSKRWIKLFGLTVQPSEVLKPFFIVVNGIILGNGKISSKASLIVSASLLSVVLFLLLLQPDVGMTLIYFFIWLVQTLIANVLPIKFYLLTGLITPFIGTAFYFLLPHFKGRIFNFFTGQQPYQVQKSIMSMAKGGLFGCGLGDGEIKYQLPDVHSDYIFSSIGEEWGLVFCVLMLLVYLYFIMYGVKKVMWEPNDTVRIIGFGIIAMFFIHVFMSVGVSTNTLPPKGTTLPFVSYGGSSILSACVASGILLSIFRTEGKASNCFQKAKQKLFWDLLLHQKGRTWTRMGETKK